MAAALPSSRPPSPSAEADEKLAALLEVLPSLTLEEASSLVRRHGEDSSKGELCLIALTEQMEAGVKEVCADPGRVLEIHDEAETEARQLLEMKARAAGASDGHVEQPMEAIRKELGRLRIRALDGAMSPEAAADAMRCAAEVEIDATVWVLRRPVDRIFSMGDPATHHVHAAEALYLRMGKKYGLSSRAVLPFNPERIERIDYVRNAVVERRFEMKRRELEQKGRPTEEILLFHGTAPTNVESILINNFDLSKCRRLVYGLGIYLSDVPKLCFSYGSALILCRVLPGRVQHVQKGDGAVRLDQNADRFDSLRTNVRRRRRRSGGDRSTAAQEEAELHLVTSPDQVLPYCVYHFEPLPPA